MNEVITPVFRIGYVGLPDENGKYSVKAIFDKDGDFDEMDELALQALRAKFGDDADPDDYKMPWNDGDKFKRKQEKKGTKAEALTHYDNTQYCNLGTRYMPSLVDSENDKPLDPRNTDKLYSGAYARAVVTAYAYEHSDNDGVSFSLQALEWVEHGDKIASGGMTFESARDAFKDAPVSKSGGKKDKGKKGKDKAKDDKTKKKKEKDKKGKKK